MLSQSMHLLRFDLLRARWWIGTYMVALSASVASGLRNESILNGGGLLPYLVIVVGMLATIILVNVDSPLRAEAFSRGHAVSPTAMILAKAASVIGLFVIAPLAVMSIAMVLNGMAVDIAAQLTKGSFQAWSIWIAISTLVAVTTRDLKTAALLFVGSMLTAAIFAGYLNLPRSIPHVLREHLMSACAVSIVMLVVAVFYRRVSGKRIVVLSGLIATVSMSAALMNTVSSRATNTVQTLPAPLILEISKVDLFGTERRDSMPAFDVVLRQDSSARYSLRSNATLTAFFVDGDSMRVGLQGEIGVPASQPIRTPASSSVVSSDGSETSSSVRSGNLAVSLAEQVMEGFDTVDARGARSRRFRLQDVGVRIRRLQSDSIQSIRIDAQLVRHLPITLASAPLRDGVVFNDGVRRLTVNRRRAAVPNSYEVTWTTLVLPAEATYGDDRWLSSSDRFSFMRENGSSNTSKSFRLRSQWRSSQSVMLPGVQRTEFKFLLDGLHPTATTVVDAVMKPATIRMIKWTSAGFAGAAGTRRLR